MDKYFQICEECLFLRKYLYGRMQELSLHIDTIEPTLPGSVLKLVGRPQAVTPLDTSKTEAVALKRACCPEAEELHAKQMLYDALSEARNSRTNIDNAFVKFYYDKELPSNRVKSKLGIDSMTFHNMKRRVIRSTWLHVKHLRHVLDLAIQ